MIKENILKDFSEIDQLDLEKIRFENDPNAQTAFEAVQIIQDALNDEIFTGVGLMGPFTTAANLAGVEIILKSMRKDKEGLHKLLDFAADITIEVGRKFVENQIGIGLAEPTASLLSPKQFREFVIPYYVKVMDKWKEWGSRGSGFHICGDTTKLLETFPEMGIRGVSIDSAVDIAVAKDLVGDKLSIMGNVSPIEILRGTPESIEQAVIDCFRKCWDNPRGFTIAPGCDVPVQTSLENIDAYMSAARKCAKFPVQPSNWGIKNYRVNFYVFPVHTVSLFLTLILENFLNKTLFIAIIYHFIYVLDNPAFLFQYRHRSGLYPNLDLCLYFLI